MKIQQQLFAIAQYMMDLQSYSFCIHSKILEILDELLPLLFQTWFPDQSPTEMLSTVQYDENNVNFKGLWNTPVPIFIFFTFSIRSGRIFISTLFVPKQLFTTRFMALKAEINGTNRNCPMSL